MTEQHPNIGPAPVDVTKPAERDIELFSVTTIIDVLDKSALKYWAAGLVAESAIDNVATWQAMLRDRGRDETVKWLRDSFNRRPKYQLGAADLGSVTHNVCEHYALTGEKPGIDFIRQLVGSYADRNTNVEAEARLVAKMLDQFDDWLGRMQPTYQATEVTVFSETWGYAGTLDAIFDIDGVRFIVDYKTSREPFDGKGKPRTPYPDQVGLQLAGYRFAELAAVWRPRRYEKWSRRYYLLGPDERALGVPVPEVDTGLAIQITPEHCESYPIRCDEESHRSFLYVLEAFRWKEITSKTVMGEALHR